jgi:hypothetical protein
MYFPPAFPCSHFRSLLLLSLSTPLLFSGCLPSGQPYQHQPPPLPAPKPAMSQEEQAAYTQQVLEPALATISGRIAAYEQRLRDWQNVGSRQETLKLTPDEISQIVSCRNRVADLQDAYKGLQTKLVDGRQSPMTREQLFGTLQDFKEKDIAYLEGDCPQLFNTLGSSSGKEKIAAQPVPESVPAVPQQEKTPPQVAQTESMPIQQEAVADNSSLRSQGMELLKSGHEQEGRSVFANLLTSARRDGDRRLEAEALQMLADIEFGHQEYASARRKYTELRRLDSSLADRSGRYIAALESVGTRRDELDTYAALLLGCLTFSPDKAGFTVVQQASEFIRLFPDSPLKTDAEDWSRKIERQAEQWFSDLIAQVGKLPPEQALKRLEQVPLDILPLDKQDVIRQKKEALPPSGAAPQTVPADGTPVQETKPAQTQQQAEPLPDPAAALQETWDKGMAAMQAEQYDEAIELFAKLNGTEFGTKAAAKTEETERLAGESVRKKAAGLFQQALNAPAPAGKKELLLSSKGLLEGILRKYPHAGIEAKVKKNLSSVDRELAAVSGGTSALKP